MKLSLLLAVACSRRVSVWSRVLVSSSPSLLHLPFSFMVDTFVGGDY